MASLKTNEKQVLEKLFQMNGGYVLNFSDRTMKEFFRDNLNVDIYDDIYKYGSGSKANVMRGFWAEAENTIVSKSIIELIEYIDNQILLGYLNREDFSEDLIKRAKEISFSLIGINQNDSKITTTVTEDEFINREFANVSLDNLGLDGVIIEVLKQRIEEIRKCLNAKASLSVVFLCGSTLEGILLGTANKYPKKFNQSNCAPIKSGKVLPFHEWTLSNLIDAGRDISILGEDVKKYSHTLRDFRNYIHPYQQILSKFDPHEHTARISWQVLQAAIYEISNFKE